MAGLPKHGSGFLLALVLVAACDSTSPGTGALLQVQGEILEAGQAPKPPLDMDIQAWPALGPEGSDSVTLRTDTAGMYQAVLGPFPDARVDSVRVRVTQYDCGPQLTTELRRRDPAPGDGRALVFPTLALSYRFRPAEVGNGQQMCGAIVTRSTPELVGDYARLALWIDDIDDISDSVWGRWRLNHSASIGDDYGYFSGSLADARMTLQLSPTEPTPCTGFRLDIPFGGDNGSTLGVGYLTGDGSCFTRDTSVRFFTGAYLDELLPPNVR